MSAHVPELPATRPYGPSALRLALAILLPGLVVVLAFFLAVDRSSTATPAAAPAVESPDAAPAGDAGGGGGGTESSAFVSTSAEEGETLTAKPVDARTAPVKPGPKTFQLVATERKFQVGDKIIERWTFNDTVPGPTMRVVVGDRVTIKLRNDGKAILPHSVDFHSSRISPTRAFKSISPGETIEYTFTAEYPGVYMYHCGTPPVLQHIGMGMYGMMIVEPKGGWKPRMQEFAIVQSELYDSYAEMEQGVVAGMSFNGIPSQYANAPIQVPGKKPKVRVFFLNAGPSELSSFHVVGTVFDKVYADGDPRNASFSRQALAIPASGGGIFEFELVENGGYPFVTHQFDHAGKGAVGVFAVGPHDPGEAEHH